MSRVGKQPMFYETYYQPPSPHKSVCEDSQESSHATINLTKYSRRALCIAIHMNSLTYRSNKQLRDVKSSDDCTGRYCCSDSRSYTGPDHHCSDCLGLARLLGCIYRRLPANVQLSAVFHHFLRQVVPRQVLIGLQDNTLLSIHIIHIFGCHCIRDE